MKVLLCGDSHKKTNERLSQIETMFPDMDLYLHTGDFEADPSLFPHWKIVAGNVDEKKGTALDPEQIIEADGHRILLIHGHRSAAQGRLEKLAKLAKEKGCDLVVFGHTHVPLDQFVDGIRILNPGALIRPREKRGVGIMILDTDTMEVERIPLQRFLNNAS